MGGGGVLRSSGRDADPPGCWGIGAPGSLEGPRLAAPPRPRAGSSPSRAAAPLGSRLGRSPGVLQSAAVCKPPLRPPLRPHLSSLSPFILSLRGLGVQNHLVKVPF